MKKNKVWIGVLIGIGVIIGLLTISYNGLVSKKETVTNSLSNLDVMLQRRSDLIPNLVNTVKGYAKHESEIIDKVTKARENMVNASSVADKSNANTELSNSLKALMVVVENYPDLKSSENFRQLSDELAGTENRIAVARKDYNDVVKTFNTSIKKFPTNIMAAMFGFKEEVYFEADQKASEVPSVNFD